MKTYNVYTPTLGEPGLEKTIDSVQKQTYAFVKHTIVTDTEEGHDRVRTLLNDLKPKRTLHYVIPEKVSHQGQYRPEYLTSGMMHLVDYDYWQNLGTGDWINPNHFALINQIYEEHHPDWIFTLRNIWDKDGQFICRDIFESIGFHPVWNTVDYLFVDGQSWCIPKKMAIKLCNVHRESRDLGERTDKFVFDAFRSHYPNYVCTNQYTLNFKLNRGTDQQLEFAKQWYLTGYYDMLKRYPDQKFPWIKERETHV